MALTGLTNLQPLHVHSIGISTFDGSVSVGGTLTYEDVTNVDSIGIVTARDDINIITDGKKLNIGASADLQLHHTANHSYVDDAGAGNLRLRSGTLEIQNLASSKTSAVFSSGGGQTLNFNNSTKFVTTNTGVVITGICTATSFKGDGSGLTNLPAAGISNVVEDTSPQLGGDLASNSHDILFADNDKAIFGTGSDFKIYHNGSHNYLMASNGDYVFDTGSSELVRITSDGKIGINNTSPSTEIELSFNSGSTAPTSGTTPKGIALSFGNSNGHNAGIWFSGDVGGDQGISGICGTRTSGYNTDLRFYTNSTGSARAFTERLRILANGGVGINTSNFSSSLNNEVGLAIHGQSNDNCRIVLSTPTKSNPPSLIGYYGLNRLGIDCHDGVEIRDVTASYATRFKIDQNGQVTKPYTYKFLVETNGTSVSGGWAKLTGLSIDSNYSTGVSNGTNWSNSNQRFTAPVSGTYLFFIGGFSSTAHGGGTNHRYMYVFQVNGSGLKYGFGGNYSDNNTPMAGGAMHIPLNANDYVEVQYYTAISATWGAGHRFFWGGYLLG